MFERTPSLRRTRLAGVTLALSLAASLALTGCDNTPDDPLAAAVAAMAQHDYPSARVLLQQALEEDPQDEEARLHFARTLMALDNPEGAIVQVERLGPQYRARPETIALLARAQLRSGKAEQALATLDAEGMDSGAAYAVAVGAHLSQGDPEAALAALEAGLARYPDAVDLVVLSAQRDFDRRDFAASRATLANVLEADPDHLDALLLAGRLEMHERNLATAKEHFERALAIRPWDMPAHLALAAIARESGAAEEAAQWVEQALELAPSHPVGTYFAAQMAFDAGEIADAQSLLNRISPSDADFPALWQLRGLVSAELGNSNAAVTELERYFTNGGDGEAARSALALLHDRDGKTARAWEVLSPALLSANASAATLRQGQDLARRLGRPEAARLASRIALAERRLAYDEQLRLADAAIRAGDWREANRLYGAIMADRSVDDPVVFNNAANVRLQLGDASGGVELARKAYALAPDDPIVLDTLGWSLIQSGAKTAEAVALIERAFALAPGHPEIAEHWQIVSQDRTS